MSSTLNCPTIPESYIHRISRTGRAGASGVAIGFCDEEEKEYLRDIQNLISKKIPVNNEHSYSLMNHIVTKKAPRSQRPQRNSNNRNSSPRTEKKGFSTNAENFKKQIHQ